MHHAVRPSLQAAPQRAAELRRPRLVAEHETLAACSGAEPDRVSSCWASTSHAALRFSPSTRRRTDASPHHRPTSRAAGADLRRRARRAHASAPAPLSLLSPELCALGSSPQHLLLPVNSCRPPARSTHRQRMQRAQNHMLRAGNV
jgi:hypothetical protein